jgi:Leucine-rich repeat (LRR) protein
MALVQCAECGKEISTKAEMCPHCGAPPAVALAGVSGEDTDVPAVLEQAIRAALRMPEGDLTPEQLAKVESLKLDEAEIGDLAGLVAELKTLPNLKMLGLKRTGVTDATPLMALGKLRYLYLEKNQITAAAPLCELKQLKQLWLYGNPLPREEVILIEQALPKCEVFI